MEIPHNFITKRGEKNLLGSILNSVLVKDYQGMFLSKTALSFFFFKLTPTSFFKNSYPMK